MSAEHDAAVRRMSLATVQQLTGCSTEQIFAHVLDGRLPHPTSLPNGMWFEEKDVLRVLKDSAEGTAPPPPAPTEGAAEVDAVRLARMVDAGEAFMIEQAVDLILGLDRIYGSSAVAEVMARVASLEVTPGGG